MHRAFVELLVRDRDGLDQHHQALRRRRHGRLERCLEANAEQ